jgi:hypothetical protein
MPVTRDLSALALLAPDDGTLAAPSWRPTA